MQKEILDSVFNLGASGSINIRRLHHEKREIFLTGWQQVGCVGVSVFLQAPVMGSNTLFINMLQ